MSKLRVIEFEYLNKDEVSSRVKVDFNTNTVEVENFTDFLIHQAYGLVPPTIHNYESLFEERILEQSKADCRQILEALGLQYYDPEAIVRITHGRSLDDRCWIRFKDENLTWDDVKDFSFLLKHIERVENEKLNR